MAIKPEPVNGGKKIVLRHVSGPSKGDLAGSVRIDGMAGIPDLSGIPRTSRAAVDDNGDQTPVNAAYQRFVAASTDDTVDVAAPAVTFSHELSALLPTGLDSEQHAEVMDALDRSAKRWGPSEPPTPEQWQLWLLTARARLTDPTNGLSDEERDAALKRWEQVAAGDMPTGAQFAVMTAADKRAWRASYALTGQAVQIASWVDADPEDVKAQIARFRAEYFDKRARGEDVEVPAKYSAAWRRLMDGSPKDPATVYSHWKAETPELYTNPRPVARFVALDLETTGLSTQDSHIIEVGLVEYDADGNELGRWNRLVRPPLDANGELSTGGPEVVAVHNIQVADVVDAPSFADLLPELQDKLAGATIIGHNLGFDTKHLKASMKKYAPQEAPDLANPTWTGEADTMFHSSRHIVGLENNKLVTVSTSLGIAYTNGHRAEHDAAVAGEVFFAIRKELKARQLEAIRATENPAA